MSAALAPMATYASDGTVTVAGNVTTNTCTITAPASFTVTLPTLSTAQLNAAGTTAGNTGFSISVTACSTNLTGATMYFEAGANIDTVTGHLKNTGTATGVEIQFLNASGSVIDLSKASGYQGATTATISTTAATLNYTARYVATAASAAGTVASTVTYSLVYN